MLKGTLTCMYMRHCRIIDPQLHSLLQASGLSPLKLCTVAFLLLACGYLPPSVCCL